MVAIVALVPVGVNPVVNVIIPSISDPEELIVGEVPAPVPAAMLGLPVPIKCDNCTSPEANIADVLGAVKEVLVPAMGVPT